MSDVLEKSPLYKKSYGVWAGLPTGHAPDYAQCCEEVWSRERWSKHYQCSKPRGYGPDKAYCKQHDPQIVKARQEASAARSEQKWQQRLLEIYGHTFYETLVKIADGHNDARGLAQEVIKKCGVSPTSDGKER